MFAKLPVDKDIKIFPENPKLNAFFSLFSASPIPYILLTSDSDIIGLNPPAISFLNIEEDQKKVNLISRCKEIGITFPFQKALKNKDSINFLSTIIEIEPLKEIQWTLSKVSELGEEPYYLVTVVLKARKEASLSIVNLDYWHTISQKIIGNAFEKQISAESYNDAITSHYENIIANLPGYVYWKDRQGVYLGCNNNLLLQAGFTERSQLIGKTDADLAHSLLWNSSVVEKTRQVDEEVMSSGLPKYNIEEGPYRLADGSEIIQLTSKIPLFSQEGNVLGILGVSLDITSKKQAEKLKRESEKQKQEAILKERENFAKLMEVLATAVAHEVRTPLNGINFCVDNLKDLIDPKNEAVLSYLEKIKSTVKGASTVSKMILTTLKISASQKVDKRYFKSYSILDTLTESLADYPFKAEERKLVSYYSRSDFSYFGDIALTKHIFLNLLKNALRAIQKANKGKITISIDTSSSRKFNQVVFKDTGCGIAPDIRENLFTQFYSTQPTGKGTGIGLTFCRLVMQAYGGSIHCRSVEGDYTEFILRFPKEENHATKKQKLFNKSSA